MNDNEKLLTQILKSDYSGLMKYYTDYIDDNIVFNTKNIYDISGYDTSKKVPEKIPEEILDGIDIRIIERYLRKKKLEFIKKM